MFKSSRYHGLFDPVFTLMCVCVYTLNMRMYTYLVSKAQFQTQLLKLCFARPKTQIFIQFPRSLVLHEFVLYISFAVTVVLTIFATRMMDNQALLILYFIFENRNSGLFCGISYYSKYSIVEQNHL